MSRDATVWQSPEVPRVFLNNTRGAVPSGSGMVSCQMPPGRNSL